MLRIPKLEVVSPRTLAEATRALTGLRCEALALAGGTDAIPKLKRRQLRARTLVDLGRVKGLAGVERRKGQVVIGAATTLAELLRAPALAGFTALREAAACVATPQIRSAATVGGNLAQDTRCRFYDQSYGWRASQGFCLKTEAQAPCRAAPSSERCLAVASGDLPPALIALDARVRVVGPRRERDIAMAELYHEDGSSPLRLGPGELIAAVTLEARGERSRYLKLRRRGSLDFASLGVAVALRLEGGVAESCRIALSGIASAPVLCEEAARLLVGAEPSRERIAQAAAAATRRARPVENADFTAAYRRRMAAVFVARALSELTGLPSEGVS